MGAKIIHCGGVGTGGAVKVSYRVALLKKSLGNVFNSY